MEVFQVNTKLVTAPRSQAVNLVQSEPKLAVQIAEALFVDIPAAEKIYRTTISLLKHRPSSTGGCLITEDFKFSQTIRIDFVYTTDLVAWLVNFGAVLINSWKKKERKWNRMSTKSTKSSSFNLKVIFSSTFPILLLTSLVLHVSDFLFKFGQLLLNVRKHIFYFLGVRTSVEIVAIDTTMRMMFRIVIGSCCFRRHFRRVRKHRHEKPEEKNFTEIFHRESTSENLLQVQVIAITDPLKEWFFNTEPSL